MSIVFDGLKPLDGGSADDKAVVRSAKKRPTHLQNKNKKATGPSPSRTDSPSSPSSPSSPRKLIAADSPSSPRSDAGQGQGPGGDTPNVPLSSFLQSLKDKDTDRRITAASPSTDRRITAASPSPKAASGSGSAVLKQTGGLLSKQVQVLPEASRTSTSLGVLSKNQPERPPPPEQVPAEIESALPTKARLSHFQKVLDEKAAAPAEVQPVSQVFAFDGVSQRKEKKKKGESPSFYGDFSDNDGEGDSALKMLTQKALSGGKSQSGGEGGGRDAISKQANALARMATLREAAYDELEASNHTTTYTNQVRSLNQPPVPVPAPAPAPAKSESAPAANARKLSVVQPDSNLLRNATSAEGSGLSGPTGFRANQRMSTLLMKSGVRPTLAAETKDAPANSGSFGAGSAGPAGPAGGIGAFGGAAAALTKVTLSRGSILKKKLTNKAKQEEDNDAREMLGKADRAFVELVHEVEEEVSLVFNDADTDADGLISSQQLKAIFSRAGGALSTQLASEVEQLLTDVDLNYAIPRERFIELFIQLWIRVERSPLLLSRLADIPRLGDAKKAPEKPVQTAAKRRLIGAVASLKKARPKAAAAPAAPGKATGLDLIRQLVTG